jgi:hypothetical protein
MGEGRCFERKAKTEFKPQLMKIGKAVTAVLLSQLMKKEKAATAMLSP